MTDGLPPLDLILLALQMAQQGDNEVDIRLQGEVRSFGRGGAAVEYQRIRGTIREGRFDLKLDGRVDHIGMGGTVALYSAVYGTFRDGEADLNFEGTVHNLGEGGAAPLYHRITVKVNPLR